MLIDDDRCSILLQFFVQSKADWLTYLLQVSPLYCTYPEYDSPAFPHSPDVFFTSSFMFFCRFLGGCFVAPFLPSVDTTVHIGRIVMGACNKTILQQKGMDGGGQKTLQWLTHSPARSAPVIEKGRRCGWLIKM